jgi:hypothetical protein
LGVWGVNAEKDGGGLQEKVNRMCGKLPVEDLDYLYIDNNGKSVASLSDGQDGALVNAVMNPLFPQNAGNFLNG